MKRTPLRSGFTLIELLLYGGLISIFLLVISDLLLSVFDMQMTAQDTSLVQVDGRYIMARLENDLSNATGVAVPDTAGANSQILRLTVGGSVVTYEAFTDQLYRTDSTASEPLNGTGTRITGIRFTRRQTATGKPSVQAEFTVTGRAIVSGDRTESLSYETAVSLR